MVPHKYLTDLKSDERKNLNLGFGGLKKNKFQIHQFSIFFTKIARIDPLVYSMN